VDKHPNVRPMVARKLYRVIEGEQATSITLALYMVEDSLSSLKGPDSRLVAPPNRKAVLETVREV